MTFALGTQSMAKLNLVKPALKLCVEHAITYSAIDFSVSQGLRSVSDQRRAVATGHSRTMKSKHLVQSDGFVWAVDLVAYVDGRDNWNFNNYGAIAQAMDKAATELGIANHVRWGCAWDRVLSDFGGDAKAYLAEAHAYATRHRGSDLIDAPHFEWVA